jgi:site-specific recombinase XerD
MKNNVSLLFYLKKPKKYVSGSVPIYMRITVDGVPKELSTGKKCDPARWNSHSGRLSGTREDVRTLNNYLDALEKQVDNAHTVLVTDGKDITAETIKNKYLGIEEKPNYLIDVFQDHNDKVKALIGVDFRKPTLTKYNGTLKHLKNFLFQKFNIVDLEVSKVDNYFISEFSFYLRTKGGCANNSAVKHLKNLGKVMRICVANKWIMFDPFAGHKNKIKKVERVILSTEELQELNNKEFAIERLQVVRDTFLLCCYTGLSFIDVQQLTKSEICSGFDGGLWIMKKRHKTLVPSHVPLLPMAQEIINRYKSHPQCEQTERVLPVFSNQKMNAYLKEVADLCGITKHLTFHIARHTFATTVTLANGIPIESVSKMLGHTDIRTTQIYAKILDQKVAADMAGLKTQYTTIQLTEY